MKIKGNYFDTDVMIFFISYYNLIISVKVFDSFYLDAFIAF